MQQLSSRLAVSRGEEAGGVAKPCLLTLAIVAAWRLIELSLNAEMLARSSVLYSF